MMGIVGKILCLFIGALFGFVATSIWFFYQMDRRS